VYLVREIKRRRYAEEGFDKAVSKKKIKIYIHIHSCAYKSGGGPYSSRAKRDPVRFVCNNIVSVRIRMYVYTSKYNCNQFKYDHYWRNTILVSARAADEPLLVSRRRIYFSRTRKRKGQKGRPFSHSPFRLVKMLLDVSRIYVYIYIYFPTCLSVENRLYGYSRTGQVFFSLYNQSITERLAVISLYAADTIVSREKINTEKKQRKKSAPLYKCEIVFRLRRYRVFTIRCKKKKTVLEIRKQIVVVIFKNISALCHIVTYIRVCDQLSIFGRNGKNRLISQNYESQTFYFSETNDMWSGFYINVCNIKSDSKTCSNQNGDNIFYYTDILLFIWCVTNYAFDVLYTSWNLLTRI